LGTESEKFGVLRSTRAPLPYDGEVSVMRVFHELCKRGWHAVRETPDGEIIALTKDGASITLEPGAQFELSGAPLPTVHDVHAENVAHLSELAPISELLGIDWLAAGYHPLATQAELSWVPKQRYAIMREYFPKVGSRGLDMMRRTATVQVNFDYRDEEDAMRKLRVALRLSPFAMAIFANSPFAEGRVTGNKSERGLVWLDVDGDRGGLLPALLDEGKRFDDYIEWALDAPMYMFKREGAVVANTGQTFRSFWKDGYQGHRPHQDDWTTHLNTMFPEARLKRTLEVRAIDSLPRDLLCAVPAFWSGLLYDETSLAAAERLLGQHDFVALQRLREDAARGGVDAQIGGRPVREIALELLELARAGLSRRNRRDDSGDDETGHLDIIGALVEKGFSPADRLVAAFEASAAGTAVERIVEACAV
jgi:glutamate--cysteine ligase